MHRSTALARVLFPALVLVLIAVAIGASAAPQPPARIPAATILGGDTVELTLPWRFHAGDDPRWADPSIDDSSWEDVGPLMEPGGLPREGWSGTGWFRRHCSVESGLGDEPLTIRISAPGVARVFLNGTEILSTTRRSSSFVS